MEEVDVGKGSVSASALALSAAGPSICVATEFDAKY